MQLPKHAMQTISDDSIFYFHLIRERETIFLALIPDGIPRRNRHRGKEGKKYFLFLMKFLKYFPFKTTLHFYLFKNL